MAGWKFWVPVDMGGNKIVNLADGVNPQEAATVAQLGGAGAVSSVFGRTGAVVAVSADYDTSKVPDSTNKRYVTDAELAVLANTSGVNSGDQTTVSGNAGTATKLATARTIDGQSFDGSADVTVIAPGTHAATGKTTPVDADELPLADSAASFVLKKLTWASLKATLKTYFDTLYASAASGVASLAKSGSTGLTGAVTLTGGTNVTLTQSGNDISIAASGGGGGTTEYDYVERSTDLPVSATSAGTANTWIDGAAVTYDGSTRIKIEACAGFTDSTQFLVLELFDGSTDLGRFEQLNAALAGFYRAIFLTPTAGAHTYHLKAWRGTGSADIYGASPHLPAWYRITAA